MIVSELSARNGKVEDQNECTWQELKKYLSEHIEVILPENADDGAIKAAKMNIGMFSPAEFKGDRRNDANVLRIHFGVIDCDNITKEQFERVKSKLALTTYLCYTTWSHTKELEAQGQYRVRFVFPFTRAVGVKLWKKTWAKLYSFFDGLIDKTCSDPQRSYFRPSTPNKRHAWTISNAGLDFDIDKLLLTRDEELRSNILSLEDLKTLSAKLARRKSEHGRSMAEALKNVINGEAFAEHGERDNKLFAAALAIVEEFPECDPEQVAELFSKSLEAMQDEGSRKASRENFVNKLARAKERARETAEENEALADEALKERVLQAFGYSTGRDFPYTQEELRAFADSFDCEVDSLKNRWIIQAGNDHYIFFNGSYRGPHNKDAAFVATHQLLAPAASAGVTTYTVDAKNNVRYKPLSELAREYGSIAENITLSMTAQSPSFDETTKTLTKPACPLRVTEAKYDSEVDKYLNLLGGSSAEKLIDFVSAITELDRPCAALYLHAPPGYGKSFLVRCLARLWTTNDPTRLSSAINQYNAEIANCPLVFADEAMPENFRRHGNTGELREFIQCGKRLSNQKYRQAVPLEGYIRLIMAANNQDLLGTPEELSKNDVEAVVERVCFIDCDNEEVRTFLESKTREELDTFLTEDRVAKHALWLRDNHVIQNRTRFILSGKNTSFHRAMIVDQGLTSSIIHWLVNYLRQPNLIDKNPIAANKILIKSGQLYVQTGVFSDHWSAYVTHVLPPTPNKLAKSLGQIAEKSKAVRTKSKGSRKYWCIDTENLITWAENSAYSDREEIEEALQRDTQEIGEARNSIKAILKADKEIV